MNKKLTRDDAVKRAAHDFKYLVIYYNVTRPQQLPYFRRNGKFSIKELNRQINFGGKSMNEVKRMNLDEAHFKQFRACQAHYNYTFGISSERVKQVLSSWRDESGKTHYIHIGDIIQQVEEELGNLTHKPHGEAWGKYSYYGKWLMDESTREKYLKDSKWSDIYKAPGVSKRFKKLMDKWLSEDKERNKKKHEENDMTVEEEKDIWIEEAKQAEPTPEVEVQVEKKQDDIYADIPPEPPKPVVEVEPPKQLKQLSGRQMRTLDNYIERFRSGVLPQETFKKYLKEEFADVLESAVEYIQTKMKD